MALKTKYRCTKLHILQCLNLVNDRKVEQYHQFFPVEGEIVPPTVFPEYPLLRKAEESYIGTSYSLAAAHAKPSSLTSNTWFYCWVIHL